MKQIVRNYGNSNRFECLNECYLNGYNQKWNCTPNDNHLLTIVLKNGIIEPNVKFCYKDDKQIKEFNIDLKKNFVSLNVWNRVNKHYSLHQKTLSNQQAILLNLFIYQILI